MYTLTWFFIGIEKGPYYQSILKTSVLTRRGRTPKSKSPQKRSRKTSTPRKLSEKFRITEKAGPSGLQDNKENERPVTLEGSTPRRNRALRPQPTNLGARLKTRQQVRLYPMSI